nr:adenosylcobinamide-GDP ribazoletransferase [Metabacillus lacus]
MLIAFQFFTSVPVPLKLPMDSRHLNKAVKMFPLLGLTQGFLYAALLYGVSEWTPFSTLTAAMILWLAGIIFTGGIHLDGWIDASDAYFSYGDKEKRLDIMSDPRTGAFGVLSVIVLLSLRFFFIYEILLLQNSGTYFLVVLIPYFSKTLMGLLLVTVKSARKEGLGTLFKQAAGLGTLGFYSICMIAAWAASFFAGLLPGSLILAAAAAIAAFTAAKKANSWFGGMTGDVLGASTEGAEVFLWMILWLLHYYAML